MKETVTKHVFQHPWDTVVQAVWRKYPNPLTKSVFGTDIVERQINKQGILETHRLMKTKWHIPSFARALLGDQKLAYGSEHSECDPKNKTLKLNSTNITYSSLVKIDETLTYSPCADSKNRTCLSCSTKVTVNSMIPFAGYLESLVTDAIVTNTSTGQDAMEWVIEKIKTEAESAIRSMDEVLNTIHPSTL
ncbi:protein slowmo-like [Ylistrum balloti]|uniref:protein slowmo-like n=1 Tax=Ylistrum balloti TaxID=509963 RepID=UPI002905A66C|nr:protein slowmo-like [Ylistrum balloti]